jgi:hypothetical protein
VDGVHAAEGQVAAESRGGAGVLGGDSEADRGGIAVERPALDQRQAGEIDLAAGGELDDLLADPAAPESGTDAKQRQELAGLRDRLAERAGRLRRGQGAEAGGDRLEAAVPGSFRRG